MYDYDGVGKEMIWRFRMGRMDRQVKDGEYRPHDTSHSR
jgi:hypothetical protein